VSAVDLTAAVGRTPDVQTGPPDNRSGTGRTATTAAQANGKFNFGDFLDVINPLQHIPGIAELYRSVTNDRISDDARKAGNALYGFALGGPVGLGAMLAYNAVGDRLNGGAEGVQPADLQVADASGVPGVTDVLQAAGTPEPGDVPVPAPKPVLKPGEAPDVPDNQGASGTRPLLGETVAAVGAAPGAPVSLAGLLNDQGSPEAGPNAMAADAGTKASSVSYVDAVPAAKEPHPNLPDEQGLGRLAAHKSNHLPLDVLKALQERHAQRTASERS